ncbi:hypothetical protein U7S25_001589 [Providencia rettgeri]|nr:hypothetical protein [Providencia rettgeri]ELR5186385.1 hypothetical protein [Providencia rettgeri]EMB0750945.1 hypothetical protein [Providencia rettgeri]
MSEIIPNVVISMPSQQFTLPRRFQAMSNGKIYIGRIDTDPTIPSNQIQVYLENEDGSTIPVSQPLIIGVGGYPVYNGQIAKFVTVEGHSMAVCDSYGVKQFYYPNVLKYDPDQLEKRISLNSGSGLVGYDSEIEYPENSVGFNIGNYSATGATKKLKREDRARRALSTSDFGDDNVDIGNSANQVIASLATEYSDSASIAIRGGEFYLPRGVRLSKTTIVIERHRSGVSSVSIKGQGQQTTEINLSGAAAFTDAIYGGDSGPTFGILSDFSVKNAPRNAIRFKKYSRMTFKNIHSESSGSDGFSFGNGFVVSIDKITASNNSAYGMNFITSEQHTSHNVRGGYAFKNGASGWHFGFMDYSCANSVASDNNQQYGFVIEHSTGFVMTACGAESNGRSAFAALSSKEKGENKGVVIDGAYAHINGQDKTGYPSLLNAVALDSTINEIEIKNSYSNPREGDTTPDIIADGIGTKVHINNCYLKNGFLAKNGGYITHERRTLLISNLSIPKSTSTVVCKLTGTQGNARFNGVLTIVAGSNRPDIENRNTAIYHFLVSKSIQRGYQMIEIAKAGHVNGGSATSPSFNWSVVNDQLIATPVDSLTGGTNFWFEIDTQSQLLVTL